VREAAKEGSFHRPVWVRYRPAHTTAHVQDSERSARDIPVARRGECGKTAQRSTIRHLGMAVQACPVHVALAAVALRRKEDGAKTPPTSSVAVTRRVAEGRMPSPPGRRTCGERATYENENPSPATVFVAGKG